MTASRQRWFGAPKPSRRCSRRRGHGIGNPVAVSAVGRDGGSVASFRRRRGTMAVTLDAVMVGGGAVDSGSHEPGSGAPAVEGRPVEPASVEARSSLPRQVEPDDAATAPWTPPSWEQVVREHSGRVYRLAYRLTGNVHDAEDLTQEVFV